MIFKSSVIEGIKRQVTDAKSDIETLTGLTWERLREIEPRLKQNSVEDLVWLVRQIKGGRLDPNMIVTHVKDLWDHGHWPHQRVMNGLIDDNESGYRLRTGSTSIDK